LELESGRLADVLAGRENDINDLRGKLLKLEAENN